MSERESVAWIRRHVHDFNLVVRQELFYARINYAVWAEFFLFGISFLQRSIKQACHSKPHTHVGFQVKIRNISRADQPDGGVVCLWFTRQVVELRSGDFLGFFGCANAVVLVVTHVGAILANGIEKLPHTDHIHQFGGLGVRFGNPFDDLVRLG